MNTASSKRRSVYADKLSEFAEFAFGDERAFSNRDKWRQLFATRIGAAFVDRMIVDIGCADAGLLLRIAAKNPAIAFVGLDWKPRVVYEAAAEVASRGLKNVALLRARAQDLPRIFGEGEIDELWLFHPEPCEREVEKKNRLATAKFFTDACELLRKESSRLFFKTDHEDYFRFVELELERVEGFVVVARSEDFWSDKGVQSRVRERLFTCDVTSYESRFIRKCKPIYFLELQPMRSPSF